MKFSDLNLLDVGHTVQMTAAVYSRPDGRGHLLLVLPGESCDVDSIEPLALSSGEWEVFLRQTDLLEVEALVGQGGEVRKAIVRKSQRQVEQGVSWRCFRRDGYRCRYCGADDVPLTVDHLVLWEEGGPSTEANLLSACRKCNRVRGNLAYADWLRHPRYVDVSHQLDEATRRANEALVATLAAIPRVPVRSRK